MNNRILEWAEARGRKDFTVHDASRIAGMNTDKTRREIIKLERAGLLRARPGHHNTTFYTVTSSNLLSQSWRKHSNEELGIEESL